jgi:hypothetical protein
MQFSTVLLALVASLCIIESTFALPTPSLVAQLSGGDVHLAKRGWWDKLKSVGSKVVNVVSANKDLIGKVGSAAAGVASGKSI